MNKLEINNLYNSFIRYNQQFRFYNPLIVAPDDVNIIKYKLKLISEDISKEYHIFSSELLSLKDTLFQNYIYGYGFCFNPCVFGQVFEILKILSRYINEEKNYIWNLVHPDIIECSKKLYLDGYYSEAAFNSFLLINIRLKNIYKKLKPDDIKVPDGIKLINTIFSLDKPLLKICDVTSETGKNVQIGSMELLKGAISAFRNPKAHGDDMKITAQDSMRRIILSSILMYTIDDAISFSNIKF